MRKNKRSTFHVGSFQIVLSPQIVLHRPVVGAELFEIRMRLVGSCSNTILTMFDAAHDENTLLYLEISTLKTGERGVPRGKTAGYITALLRLITIKTNSSFVVAGLT